MADAARALDKAKMMRFDEKSGNFYCTELGRIASHFYIRYSSVETYNEMLRCHMNDSEVIDYSCLYYISHSVCFVRSPCPKKVQAVRKFDQQCMLMRPLMCDTCCTWRDKQIKLQEYEQNRMHYDGDDGFQHLNPQTLWNHGLDSP